MTQQQQSQGWLKAMNHEVRKQQRKYFKPSTHRILAVVCQRR
jgi:hypothetical protein